MPDVFESTYCDCGMCYRDDGCICGYEEEPINPDKVHDEPAGGGLSDCPFCGQHTIYYEDISCRKCGFSFTAEHRVLMERSKADLANGKMVFAFLPLSMYEAFDQESLASEKKRLWDNYQTVSVKYHRENIDDSWEYYGVNPVMLTPNA